MPEIRDGFAERLRDHGVSPLDALWTRADSAEMHSRDGYVRPRVIFGVATVLGFFSGFQAFYYVSTFTEWPASLPFLLALNLGYWYSWACLTPAILWLARRGPLERESWKRAVVAHIPGVFLCTVAHIAMTVASQTDIVWIAGQEQRAW